MAQGGQKGLFKAYKEVVPASMRLFGESIFGERGDIDASKFSDTELKILEEAALAAEERGESVIGYGDFGEADPWASGWDQIKSAVFDKGGSMANTIGMARIGRDETGALEVTDMYDWGATEEEQAKAKADGTYPSLMQAFMEGGPMGPLNRIGNDMFPKGKGRNVKIRLPSRVEEDKR